MATTNIPLSGSVNYLPFLVSATPTLQTIHTAIGGVGPDNFDAVYLYATNYDPSGTTRSVTITWGADAAIIIRTLPLTGFGGLVPLVAGLRLNNGTIIKGYGSAAFAVLISGYVLRTTP